VEGRASEGQAIASVPTVELGFPTLEASHV